MPHVKAPHMDKSKDNVLRWIEGDQWEVQSNGETVERYHTSDLRITIVYRARCFASDEELQAYKAFSQVMDADQVLKKMTDAMVKSKVLKESDKTRSRDEPEGALSVDLAIKLIDHYIQYPLPPRAKIPYNYCALPIIFPLLEPVFSLFCR